MFRLLLISSLLFVFASCEKEPEFREPAPQEPVVSTKSYDNVDQILWPYFERFENEAAERGIEVDLTEVHAMLVEIPNDGVAGDCTFDPVEPNRIRVDLTTWNQVDQNLKEYIVFHELGHCDRIQKHREAEDASGVCVSIMASGVGGCRANYNQQTRESLLDELFDPQFFGDWQ